MNPGDAGKSYRGFRHFHSDEQLLRYVAVPAAEKLKWLEEINAFLQKAMSPEAKAIAERFRHGEI